MTTTPIDNTSITTDFNVDELTEGTLTGKGVFDVLLQTLRLHLDREFNSNRITGTAYATVYSQAITAFLAQAAQYAISKAKLPLELQLLQEQINLTQKQQYQITAAIRQTDYVTDYQLPSEVANKTKQTELLAYELTNIKPVELSIAQQDLALKTAQADLVEYDLTTIKPQELALLQQQIAVQLYTVQTRMPAEVANIQAETALKAYDLVDIKPNEKAQIIQQTSNLEAQKAQIIAETGRITYTTQYQLPEEVELIKRNQAQTTAQTGLVNADIALKAYDLTDIKPTEKAQVIQQTSNLSSQQEQIVAETSRVLYEVNYRLPEEVTLIKLNQDQLIAQNNKIATDTVVTIKQGHLTDAQTCQVKAETNQVNAVVATKLPKEVAQIEAQTSLLAYDLTDIKPAEKSNLINTGLSIAAQTANTEQNTLNLVKQGNLTDSQKGEIDYRVATLLPTQTAQNTAQTAQITYTTSYVLPSQVSLTNAQTSSATAQTALYNQKTTTELAQTTTTPASGSVMGVQNALMAKQAENYDRDAEQKAAKLMLETINVRFTADTTSADFDYVNHLSDADVGVAVSKLISGIGGTVAPPPPPPPTP